MGRGTRDNPHPQSSLAEALDALIVSLTDFLESGMRSGSGQDDEPPDRDMILPKGEVHNAIISVQHWFPRKTLPSPKPRTAWRKLIDAARNDSLSPDDWQTTAHKKADKIRKWAENFRGGDAAGSDATMKPVDKKALRIIKEEGPIPGKVLAPRIPIAKSTLGRHIIPRLKKLGVKNDKDGRGYYFPDV